MTNDETTVLVLGATGGIGGEVARQLRDAGWSVRALKRGLPEPVRIDDGMTWIRGDAMNRDDVRAAAASCRVIVHAVNPPGYRRWGQLVLPMIDNTIAAAAAEGATIVLPGTVYNYGPDASRRSPRTRRSTRRLAKARFASSSSAACATPRATTASEC